jgi:hypothetical protein
MFGFSSQLNDFSIENMERQISLFHEISANPVSVELPEPAMYDSAGIDTILEGFERRDFRNLDHTLQNIGRSFQN